MSQVMTVTGPVATEQLAITMFHVHVLSDYSCYAALITPDEASKRILVDAPITMDVLGMLRRHNGAIKANLIHGDLNEAIAELMHYQMAGGVSLVECTAPGVGRDVAGLARISRATGINIICSTGFHCSFNHPPFVKNMSIEQLSDHMVTEITVGIGGTGIKAGCIKVALGGAFIQEPFTPEEERVLRAAGRAQAKTGVPISIHPNFLGLHWHTYLDVLEEEGADLGKVCAGHQDLLYWPDLEYQKSVLARGACIGYDQFGNERYAPTFAMPNDKLRVDNLLALIGAGYIDRILISCEIESQTNYRKYGGFGYDHVLENIVPALRHHGLDEQQLKTLLVDNPKRLLESRIPVAAR